GRETAGPASAIEDPMVVLEVRVGGAAEGVQGGGHGAFARGQDRPGQEELGVRKDDPGEEWSKGQEQCYHIGRQGQHRRVLSSANDDPRSFSCRLSHSYRPLPTSSP